MYNPITRDISIYVALPLDSRPSQREHARVCVCAIERNFFFQEFVEIRKKKNLQFFDIKCSTKRPRRFNKTFQKTEKTVFPFSFSWKKKTQNLALTNIFILVHFTSVRKKLRERKRIRNVSSVLLKRIDFSFVKKWLNVIVILDGCSESA